MTSVTSYKGFTSDLKCREFQFEVGGTYEHHGDVNACNSGFHACEYPLDVLRYYEPNTSRYCVVEQSGTLSRHTDDSKIASQRLTITAEISIPGLVKAAIDYTFSRAKTTKEGTNEEVSGAASATGFSGVASATGDIGAASATGFSGAASATGISGVASATGIRGAASATGIRGAASATGFSGAASATGDSGVASATGDIGVASATGFSGAASATGDSGVASATGDIGVASATGVRGVASATGISGAAMSSGHSGRVMGADGCALFLVQRDSNHKILRVWAGIVGRGGIKANVWYTLKAGKPVVAA